MLDLNRLPFPLSNPLYILQHEKADAEDTSRSSQALFAAYQAVRLAVLLMLADYLESGPELVDETLASKINGLHFPHWQEWIYLGNALAIFWSKTPDRLAEAMFPTVVTGWLEVARPKPGKGHAVQPDAELKALIDDLASVPGLQEVGRTLSAAEAIQKWRNLKAHGGQRGTSRLRAIERQERERLEKLILAFIDRLFGKADFVLFRGVRGPQGELSALRLEGAHPNFLFTAEPVTDYRLADALELTDVAAIRGEQSIPIYPLLLHPDDSLEAQPSGLNDPIVMIERVTNRELVLLGVERETSLPNTDPHHAAVLSKLRAKHADLRLERHSVKPWTITTWSRMSTEETLRSLTGVKYFPEFYLDRERVDGVIERWLENQGKSALLLIGDAGSGKSSALSRLVDRLTGSKAGPAQVPKDRPEHLEAEETLDNIAYLSGRADYAGDTITSGDQLLADIVAAKLGIKPRQYTSLAELALGLEGGPHGDTVKNRRLIIILDGINEAERLIDLKNAVDRFLAVLPRAPHTRLVLSCRTGAYFSLAQRDEKKLNHGAVVFANDSVFATYQDDSGKMQPYFAIPPFTPPEGQRAYELRQKALPERSAEAPYESLGVEVKNLLRQPLYLHLFHEALSNQESAPATLDEGGLFDLYLNMLAGGGQGSIAGLDKWLTRLAHTMIDERKAVLPVEVAEAWQREWRGSENLSARDIAVKLDPIEEFVSANVLLRPQQSGYGADSRITGFVFAHQKLAERVLLRHIDRSLGGTQ